RVGVVLHRSASFLSGWGYGESPPTGRRSGALGATSITEGREPNGQVAHGEPAQIPGAATRDLPGLGAEKPGERPLEAQPRAFLADGLADLIGYLAAAEAEHIDGCAGREQVRLGPGFEANAGGVVHGDRVRDELAVIGGHAVPVGELAGHRGATNREVD